MLGSSVISILGFGLAVKAAPSSVRRDDSGVTSVSVQDLDALAPYSQFARAAYCDSDKVRGWQCGDACDAVSRFQVTLTGGNGDDVQLFYVGYWPDQNSVVVAHEGTDPTQFESDLTDVNIAMSALNSTLFPGVPDGVEAHQGFADEHAKTADAILAEVKNLINDKGAKSVTLVGHSLGGALSVLECLYMKLNLPDVAIKGVTYGLPRVGNPDFASYFDSQISDFKRVNNKKDLIPIVPGRFLGFSHVQGEIHILDENDAVACPGDDDADDDQCTIKTVPNVAEGDILNHLGPYQGISMGTIYCT